MANVNVLSQVSDKQVLLDAHAAVKEEYDWFVTALDERRASPGMTCSTWWRTRPSRAAH